MPAVRTPTDEYVEIKVSATALDDRDSATPIGDATIEVLGSPTDDPDYVIVGLQREDRYDSVVLNADGCKAFMDILDQVVLPENRGRADAYLIDAGTCDDEPQPVKLEMEAAPDEPGWFYLGQMWGPVSGAPSFGVLIEEADIPELREAVRAAAEALYG